MQARFDCIIPPLLATAFVLFIWGSTLVGHIKLVSACVEHYMELYVVVSEFTPS